MKPEMPGLHHVTAITTDAQQNIDFYCGALGLRFIKLTVNFDDPASYHLYYGDEHGRPGTAMTFFAWNGGRRGRVGPPQAVVTQFAVPAGAIDFWVERLKQHDVKVSEVKTRFGESVLAFTDPDQMPLEIVATSNPGGVPPKGGPVPAEFAIRGFYGVTLAETDAAETAQLLTNVMGYTKEAQEETRTRYRASNSDFASIVDIQHVPDAPRGMMGTGVVHHVAFRAPDDDHQKAWQTEIQRRGLEVSPVRDRCYFHSIYFREPGGVLFEIATDLPGFSIDESFEDLGTALQLPPWMENDRAQLEKLLPPVKLPRWNPHA